MQMMPSSEHTLSDHVLNWVIESVDSTAAVQSINQLHGGMSSIVHSISLLVNQEEKKVVLRQFDNEEWLLNEPDLPLHEAESLRFAAKVAVQTPQIIAFDETGSECGMPSVLMTQLDGSIVLQPPNIDQWLNGMAEALVRIHAVDADHYPWTYFTYNDISSLQTPAWSKYPALWDNIIDLVRGPRPSYKPCFIHRDYHPTNVLWNQNKISGVVDWVNACQGPAGIDIGHCRLNLALLYDVPTADGFLSAYQRHAGASFHYEPFWDLLSLIDILFGPPTVYPGWAAFGVTGLTDDLMIERLDSYMTSLLSKALNR
jgi:aminoglycoside phosphotransferase (APT) family kinase protein